MARGWRRGWWLTRLLALGAAASPAFAECLTLKSGPIVYDVSACMAVQPEQTFDFSQEKYRWVADLDPAGRKQLLDRYRGLYLKGKVVKSQAVEKGMGGASGVLSGEAVPLYLMPGALSCGAIQGKRLSGNLREICCDGGGEPPCLLGTGYLLASPQVLGAASSGAGDAVRQKARRSKTYQAADQAFRQRQWKDAAKLFEQARVNDELDVAGHYKLGLAYRELDQCGDAILPLKKLHGQYEKNTVWGDEVPLARAAVFLLARCHAKLNDPGSAVLLLNSYLLEPAKYRKELQDSLAHRDFGWIHTSREYREYKKAAQKKLGTVK